MKEFQSAVTLSFLFNTLLIPPLHDSIDGLFVIPRCSKSATLSQGINRVVYLASLILGEKEDLISSFNKLLLAGPHARNLPYPLTYLAGLHLEHNYFVF